MVADIDSLDENQDYVVLMTLHSAKGLEFPQVYLVGMEDGLFPSYMTITSDDTDELEEERRLCYVGITRAENELTMTCSRSRMIRGQIQYNRISRFLQEVPKELLETGRRVFSMEEKTVPVQNTFKQAKQIFHKQPFQSSSPLIKGKQQFAAAKEKGLSYGV